MLNSLNISLSGLKSSQAQMEGIMNNISNEDTEGYKTRVVNLSEAAQVDDRTYGRGVVVGDTTRITNYYMNDNLNSEESKKSYNDELTMMLDDVESIFKETDDNGLSVDLNNLFQSYEDYRSNPSSSVYKNEVIDNTNQFTLTIKDLKTNISDRKDVTRKTLEDDVDNVNNLLTQIGDINEDLSNTFDARNDLLDKRDQLEKELSKYVDISVERTPYYSLKIGDVTVVTENSVVNQVNLKTDKTAQMDIYNSDTLGDDDILEFSYNGGEYSISVQEGETVDGDEVTDDNKYEKLAYKINQEIPGLVEAKKVTVDGVDRIQITSKIEGEEGKFRGKLVLKDIKQDSDGNDYISDKSTYYKDTNLSINGGNDVYLETYDTKIDLKKGKLKSMTENLSTNDPNNKFQKYSDQLDDLVEQLVNYTDDYKFKDVDTDGDGVADAEQYKSIDLFDGATVESLTFKEENVDNLNQDSLDYLASIQYDENIDFDHTGQNNQSFKDFYKSLLVGVSSDTEDIHFRQEVQDSITASMQLSYDKITKVDNDEQMMELMKVQSAYEANAKVITTVDQMLKTLLNMTN